MPPALRRPAKRHCMLSCLGGCLFVSVRCVATSQRVIRCRNFLPSGAPYTVGANYVALSKMSVCVPRAFQERARGGIPGSVHASSVSPLFCLPLLFIRDRCARKEGKEKANKAKSIYTHTRYDLYRLAYRLHTRASFSLSVPRFAAALIRANSSGPARVRALHDCPRLTRSFRHRGRPLGRRGGLLCIDGTGLPAFRASLRKACCARSASGRLT